MRQTKSFDKLTREDLQKLRNEIVLNSCYFYDYTNSFGFDEHDICEFFDGYYDYLWELAGEKYNTDEITLFQIIGEFDNIDNLVSWFNCYDDLSWVRINEEEDDFSWLRTDGIEECYEEELEPFYA